MNAPTVPFYKMSRPEARLHVREALETLLLAFALNQAEPEVSPSLDLPDRATQ